MSRALSFAEPHIALMSENIESSYVEPSGEIMQLRSPTATPSVEAIAVLTLIGTPEVVVTGTLPEKIVTVWIKAESDPIHSVVAEP